MVTERTNGNDLGYFDEHPAPIYEAMTKLNPAKYINHTTPHYGPLLYNLGRINGGSQMLEIGVAYGWASGFLAHAVKDNNVRYGMTGKYYGLDIGDKSELQKNFEAAGLPVEFIQHEAGSVDFLEKKCPWDKEFFDLIFIDGWHNNDYVKREVELVYPLLKGNGNGYLFMHDVYAYVESAWDDIIKDPRYQWEYMRFLPNYGFGMLRKMENYDPKKVFWPEGDQKAEQGFVQ